ncbi:Uncharacterized protein SCF082_LOCUS50599 [Durusdinium trenchii]|uniref:Uncharacterized protein n=1 Tax=Durusdinium trenchii TaxID=1381693 RepID=A0ABP0S8V1_9DINO
MPPAPLKKKVPLQFPAWLVVQEDTLAENIFSHSQLALDRSTRDDIVWLSEAQYIIPEATKDALPHASEGTRSYSDVQESAQYLAGDSFPKSVLSSLLNKTELPNNFLAVCNLTPYDAYLEKTCMYWGTTAADGNSMASLSIAKSCQCTEYCERVIATQLLEDGNGWMN